MNFSCVVDQLLYISSVIKKDRMNIMIGKYSGKLKLLAIFVAGTFMWFNPVSSELPIQSWHLLTIFLGTMLGIILNPMPISAVALLGASICIATGTLTTNQVLNGFGEKVVWLLLLAFLIARGIIKTGLGKRIAYYFISKLGKTTLGVSYGLVFAEFFLAPIIPSVTARGGGVIYPIAESLASEYGSDHSPAHIKRNRGFISQVCFQTNIITSTMFLTAMAANPLVQSLAYKEGIEITWASWALGAIVPGIVSLILMPLLVYIIHPPAIKQSPEAPKAAKEALKKMGKVSLNELTMIIVFVALIVGWVLDKKIGLDATSVALFGVVALLVTGVLEWNDVVNEKGAWDSFVWFAVMVMLSGYLAEFGTIKWIGVQIGAALQHYPATVAIPLLMVIYFYLHYLFASATAHATVLFATFLFLILGFGASPMLSGMVLAYFTALSSGLTHYGIATAPIYYESKSVSTREWWTIGVLVSFLNLTIWGVIGGAWWKYLGWF